MQFCRVAKLKKKAESYYLQVVTYWQNSVTQISAFLDDVISQGELTTTQLF